MTARWILKNFLYLCFLLFAYNALTKAYPVFDRFDPAYTIFILILFFVATIVGLFVRTKSVTSKWNPERLLKFYREDAAFKAMDMKSQKQLYADYERKMANRAESAAVSGRP